jgi:hypothetical protein
MAGVQPELVLARLIAARRSGSCAARMSGKSAVFSSNLHEVDDGAHRREDGGHDELGSRSYCQVPFEVDDGDGTTYGGTMSATLETFTTDGRVVISFLESALSPDKREEFLTLLKSEWSARQSRLTKEDATRLAKELDAGWWSRNRERILGKIEAS